LIRAPRRSYQLVTRTILFCPALLSYTC